MKIPPATQFDVPQRLLECVHSVRIDVDTNRKLKRIARDEHITETVGLTVRRYDQAEMGRQLALSVGEDEIAWLKADFG